MTSVQPPRFLKAAGTVGSFTLLSRILGFVRDVVVARAFGAGMGADAFFVALKLPNFLRRLFAEGSFNTAFIPVFSDYLAQGDEDATRRAAHAVFTVLTLVLLGVVAVAQIAMPLLIMVAAPGFIHQPEKFDLTVLLTRITFPYILLISLTALAGGILNTHRRFALPAFTPALLNVAMILGALVFSRWFDPPVVGLAVGVFLGGVLQLAIQIPALKRIGVPFRFHWEPTHAAVKRVLTLMGPSILGVSVAQINLLFDILLASFLPAGSISFLYYADRLVEFPLGVFGIALATAILPTLSAKAARDDMVGLKSNLDFALRFVIITSLPAAVGLVIMAEPIISLLFERGAFGPETTDATARALYAYGLGLVAFAGVKVIAPAFYAMKDTKTPVRIAIISMLTNMVLNLILMVPLKHAGLALATTLAAFLNMSLLLRHLSLRIDYRPSPALYSTLFKTLAATTVMGVGVRLGYHAYWDDPVSTWDKAMVLLPLIFLAITLFFLTARLLRLKELSDVAAALRRRR